MHDIKDIIKNIESIYESNSNMAILKDFERVLDEVNMYVYENWMNGEIAYGPTVDRHWITTGFMWERAKMPDPMAAKRLTELGCKVKYEKTHMIEPRRIKKPDDIRPGTKKGHLDHKPIWIVEITMPKKLAFDIYKGYMDRLREEKYGKNPKAKTAGAAPQAAEQAAAAPALPGAAGAGAVPGAEAGGATGMPPAAPAA
jgi:hypothetical protein